MNLINLDLESLDKTQQRTEFFLQMVVINDQLLEYYN